MALIIYTLFEENEDSERCAVVLAPELETALAIARGAGVDAEDDDGSPISAAMPDELELVVDGRWWASRSGGVWTAGRRQIPWVEARALQRRPADDRAALTSALERMISADLELMSYAETLEAAGMGAAFDAVSDAVFCRVEARTQWAGDHGVRRDQLAEDD